MDLRPAEIVELADRADARPVGRNRGAAFPGAIGVAEEVGPRRDAAIHAADVESRGNDRAVRATPAGDRDRPRDRQGKRIITGKAGQPSDRRSLN